MKATTKTNDFPYPLKRGETIDTITQYNVNKKTGATSFDRRFHRLFCAKMM
jgi:hypothetical protein